MASRRVVVFTSRLPEKARRILEDRETLVHLFRVHLYMVDIARLLHVSTPTVKKAREAHGIPLFPRTLLHPDWHGTTLTDARWQTVKLHAYAGFGRCPPDCVLSVPCEDRWWAGEGTPGEMLPDCPVRFYFSASPHPDGDRVCDLCHML